MDIIQLTADNIADQHICCAFSDKKCSHGYLLKKDWLSSQFASGHVFKKFDVKHKVFIEYGPAQHAWAPVQAEGYLHIGCFWVAGQYKGKGYGKQLLEECLQNASSQNGVTVISSPKKKPFLADKKFFLKHGFEVCATAEPYFELLVKKTNPKAQLPCFTPAEQLMKVPQKGLSVFYSNLCPFTEYYVNTELANLAATQGIKLEIIKLDTLEKARKSPCPFTIYSLFYNGQFLTHEIVSAKKFEKLVTEYNIK